MKRKLAPTATAVLLGIGLFAVSLVSCYPLRMSVAEMKRQTALALDVGCSQSQVLAFVRGTHLATQMADDKYDDECPPPAERRAHMHKLTVQAKALLTPPVLLEFAFRDGRLTSYSVSDGEGPEDFTCGPT